MRARRGRRRSEMKRRHRRIRHRKPDERERAKSGRLRRVDKPGSNARSGGSAMKQLCLAVALALATFALHAGGAVAQTYPNKPIRIVVPFVAGGAVDMLARMLGAKLSESLGQPVIVENRPGAGGNVAADAVAKSPPDGYTILQNTNGQAISPAIYRSLPFDVVRDFIPVTQLVASQLVLAASPKLAANSVAELIALAKA